jgi:ferredoxin-NADP reductase
MRMKEAPAAAPFRGVLPMLEPASLGIISGATLLGAAGLRAVAGVNSLRRRATGSADETERRRAQFTTQLQAALHWARASQSALKAWTGTRPFRVSAVVDEAEDCRSFYLMPEDGRPLPRFEPGQYLTFHLPTGDPARPLVRCYSLSERPREDFYRVTVKRVAPPADHPHLLPGRGSTFFHREARPGARLAVEAPQGAFFLDPTDSLPVVLVGAGIGVTPLMSMAAALVHWRDERSIYFFAGFRNSREHPFRARLAEFKAEVPNLHLDVSYSRPLAGDLHQRDFDHRGYVDVPRLRRVLPSSNFRYYVCGPAPMMQTLVPALLEWGVPAEHIRYEAFGPATVRGLNGGEATAPCDVQFARSARSARWTGNEGSLLELAEQNRVPLEFGCRAGSCGQCRVMIAAGRVKHAKQPGVELVDGECLACIAQPQGDVVVEA